MKRKKVLVTGGLGYIGSHAAVLLLEAGYEIVIVDNLSSGNDQPKDAIKKITGKDFSFVKADICDQKALDSIFKRNSFDSVIHFAGLKDVNESVSNPIRYYEKNILGGITLIKTMKKFNVKKIIFSSSANVYGNVEKLPVRENSNSLKPTNPYGMSKMIVEIILNDLYKSDPTWSIMHLRYFNPVGAHSSGLIGEDISKKATNLMPIICNVANGKLDYLKIFGKDYDTEDGTAIRDYIHVVDLAEGHLKALEKLSFEKGVWTFNLGTGSGCTVLNLVKIFEKANKIKIPYKFFDRREGDIESSFADVEKVKETLEWKSKRTLEDMCIDSWRWCSKN